MVGHFNHFIIRITFPIVIIAPERFANARSAWERFAPLRSASERLALERCALERSASERCALERFILAASEYFPAFISSLYLRAFSRSFGFAI